MNILAIDTSTEYLSMALQSEKQRTFFIEKIGNRHTEFALDKIKYLLDEHSLKVADLNRIAYNQGPGSFTGLRIGLSLALGLALGLDVKLVPIPSFMIFAEAFKNKYNLSGNILVGLDARLNQLYLAGVNLDTLEYFLKPTLIDPDKIDCIEGANMIGNGFTNYINLLKPDLRQVLEIQEYNLDEYPNALNMLDLVATNKFSAIDVKDADLLYLRDKIALNLNEQAMLKSI